MQSVKLTKIDAPTIPSAPPTILAKAPAQDNASIRLKLFLTNILEGNKKKSSIDVLDGVRALAILIVVFYHLNVRVQTSAIPWMNRYVLSAISSGYSGVTLFFVLSGFLLFLPSIKSLLFDNPWPSMRTFYLRRLLRIVPGYYISLFLIITLFDPDYLRPDHWEQLLLFLTFFMDSTHSTFQQLSGPYWTLAVEMQFYLVLPWLVLAIRFFVQRGSLKRRVRVLIICLLCVIAWGIGTRFCGYYVTGHPKDNFGVPHMVLLVATSLLYGTGGFGIHGKFYEDFATGMIIAVCYMLAGHSSTQGKLSMLLRRLSPWLLIVSIVWLYIMALWGSHLLTPSKTGHLGSFFNNETILQTFHEFGLALGFGALVVAVLFGGPTLVRVFEWTPLRWIGMISFSIYIWHSPLSRAYTGVLFPIISNVPELFLLGSLWFIFAIIPFSFGYFALIERPFITFSNNLRKNQNQARSVESMQVALKD